MSFFSLLKIRDFVSLFKLDVDPRRDDNASPDFISKNEGSMVQTYRNINVHAEHMM